MIPRCVTCRRRIWPWQHYGWSTWTGHTDKWHAPVCTPWQRRRQAVPQ